MSDTTFQDYVTPIPASWLNDVNDHTYNSTPIAPATTVHPANVIANTPAGNLAATTVQDALNELDTEKAAQSSLTAHIDDTTAAHTASAIANTPAGSIAATDVQAAINELDTEKLSAATAASTYAPIAGNASQVFSVGTATADAHAVGAKQIQTQAVTAFTTAGTATAFTLTTTNAPALTTGERWFVTFNAAAGATPTLDRDSKGAKALKYRDSAGAKQAITSTQVPSGWSSDVVYDGTDYIVIDVVRNMTPDYTSAGQTITAGGALTLAHGLGKKPALVMAHLLCVTGEAGYTAGMELEIPVAMEDFGGGTATGFICVPDATNLNIRYATTATTFRVINYTTGALVNLTNANWSLVLKAWR